MGVIAKVFLCFILVINYQDPLAWSPWKKNAVKYSEVISLEISLDKNDYYIREPLKLNITLKNKSNHEVIGTLMPRFYFGQFRLYYRYKNEPYIKYDSAKEEFAKRISLKMPKSIKPQETVKSREWIVFDVYKEKFVLERIGIYEFKAVYEELYGDYNFVESNSLIINVIFPPEKEKSVLEVYNDETIARLIQGDYPYLKEKGLQATKNLYFLLRNYPNSLYVKHFRRALARGKHYWDPLLIKDKKHPYEEVLTFPKNNNNDTEDEIDVRANGFILEGLEDINE